MPHETAVALGSMILGGVFERHPKLRVCFAHGGGCFPALIGRIAHGFHARPDLCQLSCKTDPRCRPCAARHSPAAGNSWDRYTWTALCTTQTC